MSPLVRPFTGFLPNSEFGPRVVGPPRSMLAPAQQSAGTSDPLSFRHVVGRSASPTKKGARAWLDQAIEAKAILPVANSVMVHSCDGHGVHALGLLADISISAYTQGTIKPHEKTIARTEKKMVDYMSTSRLYGNPVVLSHQNDSAITERLQSHASSPADVEFDARDGTRHRLWIVTGQDAASLCELYHDELYIADGHHRLAAAATLAQTEGRADDCLPAGIYGESEFVVWAFARGVSDTPINGDSLIARLDEQFELVEVDQDVPRPPARHTIAARIAERSFLLTIPDELIVGDSHARLDVSLLQNLILEPILGVTDPRHDQRLVVTADSDFEDHDPDQYDAWFLPYPTLTREVRAVADMGRTMPPKSTFFLPKIPSGIAIRPLDS